MKGLEEGQRCIVSLVGGGMGRGRIFEVLPKGYRVLLDGEKDQQSFPEVKVKPESYRRPTAPLSALAVDRQPVLHAIRQAESEFLAGRPIQPMPRPAPPELCPAWLVMVRKLPCCNCPGVGLRTEAHHEGKKGVGQKVRDTMAVPLCVGCHAIYTNKNQLPDPEKTRQCKELVLRSREESVELLRNAQEHLLTAALGQLEQGDRIEVISKGIAQLTRKGALAPVIDGAADFIRK